MRDVAISMVLVLQPNKALTDVLQQLVQQGATLQENVAMCNLGKGCVATNRKMLQYISRRN